MSISPSYPITLQNGTTADATQVMADFYQIQNDVNANAAHSGVNSDITQLTGLTTALAIIYGGTGSTTASGARANLGAASSGANSDITAILGLTTPLPVSEGGTGATAAGPDAAHNIGAAALGVNSDITSIIGLTTPLPISEGGTGATTAAQALVNLGAASTANGQAILGKVRWNTGGIITSAGVIQSVTRVGTGIYDIVLSTAQPSKDSYVVTATYENPGTNNNPENIVYLCIINRTTTGFRVTAQSPGSGGGTGGGVEASAYNLLIA